MFCNPLFSLPLTFLHFNALLTQVQSLGATDKKFNLQGFLKSSLFFAYELIFLNHFYLIPAILLFHIVQVNCLIQFEFFYLIIIPNIA
jgi:hypothetical protein